MKRRIFKVLLLITATALVSIPCVAPVMGQKDMIETDVAAQEETSTITEEENIIISKKEWFEGWTTNVVNVRLEPSEDSKILEVWDECTYLHGYQYDNEWIATIYSYENDVITLYIKSEYITRNSVENEYRQLMKERLKAEDKKEWFLKYKEFMGNPDFEDKPETIYDCFSEQELDLLFKVVQAEIGDYSFDQKVNVANVIFNRITHERFGETLNEVLVPSQFATISNGRINRVKVDEDTILACEYAFLFEDTTNGALFFDSDGSLNYEQIGNDGAHNFYTLKEEINKDE